MKFNRRPALSLAAICFCNWIQFGTAGDNVVIVLDDSGSMNERMSGGIRRIDAAKKAIAEVLRQFPVDTKLGLMLLNGDRSKQHWAIPLEHLSVPQATRRVEAVGADGGTPLGERMREGADALLQLREKQIYGNYRLLIVTDGEANDARQLALYLPDVLSRGLTVDAIGVDMKKNHSLATRVHTYRRADDQAALSKAIEEVFAEKMDSSSTDAGADFSLLQAFDDNTAKEALLALSRPNNSSVIGVSSTNYPSVATQGNTQVNPQSGVTWGIGILVAALTICVLPLVVTLIVLGAFFRKANQKNRNRFRR